MFKNILIQLYKYKNKQKRDEIIKTSKDKSK
jgi:hypothetical protein